MDVSSYMNLKYFQIDMLSRCIWSFVYKNVLVLRFICVDVSALSFIQTILGIWHNNASNAHYSFTQYFQSVTKWLQWHFSTNQYCLGDNIRTSNRIHLPSLAFCEILESSYRWLLWVSWPGEALDRCRHDFSTFQPSHYRCTHLKIWLSSQVVLWLRGHHAHFVKHPEDLQDTADIITQIFKKTHAQIWPWVDSWADPQLATLCSNLVPFPQSVRAFVRTLHRWLCLQKPPPCSWLCLYQGSIHFHHLPLETWSNFTKEEKATTKEIKSHSQSGKNNI